LSLCLVRNGAIVVAANFRDALMAPPVTTASDQAIAARMIVDAASSR
jgi:hypothetical protein